MKKVFWVLLVVWLILLCSCTPEQPRQVSKVKGTTTAVVSTNNTTFIPTSTTPPQVYGDKHVYTEEEIQALDAFEGSYDVLVAQYPDRYELSTTWHGDIIVYYGQEKVAIFRYKGLTEVHGWTQPISPPKSEFDLLKAGDNILLVLNISPMQPGVYPFGYTGIDPEQKKSFHFTSDGYLVEIEYEEVQKNGETDLCIKEISNRKLW